MLELFYNNIVTTVIIISIFLLVLIQLVFNFYFSIKYIKEIINLKNELDKQKLLRETERKGRISLQKKYRDDKNINSTENGFTYLPIGIIVSPYIDRRGTPRQPLLVTKAKGYIKFNNKISKDFYNELSEFSHIWIIFIFHENTNTNDLNINAKIKPPRLNGKKVGCLSTRSPHRPNNIGLSVCKIESVGDGYIEISGLDIVDGSPVIDIKPYVPCDSVPIHESLTKGSYYTCFVNNQLVVPNWVSESDIIIRNVNFSQTAIDNLEIVLQDGLDRQCQDINDAKELISQVLQQDIRGIHQGRGKISDDKENDIYECRLDKMIIKFVTFENDISVVSITSI